MLPATLERRPAAQACPCLPSPSPARSVMRARFNAAEVAAGAAEEGEEGEGEGRRPPAALSFFGMSEQLDRLTAGKHWRRACIGGCRA